MAFYEAVPRRCVNLPPGTLRALVGCVWRRQVQEGPALEAFYKKFGKWLGAPHVLGASSGRAAFRLALEALNLEPGAEIIFPSLTFPVIPMVAKMLGYEPVFCAIDPATFNAGPEQIAPHITDRTGAIVATHLFGQPCDIEGVVSLARQHRLRVMEDCAHACGVRIDGRQVGTFGDVGVFSFAEGKNMPCLGGGAMVTSDAAIAARAEAILAQAPMPDRGSLLKEALSIWGKGLLTRPGVFGLTAYPVLRLKLWCGQALLDSTIGDALLEDMGQSPPRVRCLANLQATIGLLQLKHVDTFNEGARRNAQLLTDELVTVTEVSAPQANDGHHIYVYYPLVVASEQRDDLRHYLLRRGIDAKTTDMSNCPALRTFSTPDVASPASEGPDETSILEICVYPSISAQHIRHMARVIQTWAGVSSGHAA